MGERLRCCTAAVLAAGLLGFPPGASAGEGADAEFELLGSWHVLVHYRDVASENPDAERWQDKVWRFEQKGSRLQWTEFPLVVFDDDSGRFEAPAGGRVRRVLAFWEPNESQRREIAEGVRVNPQGARVKTLRGSPSRGYRSAGGLRNDSAAVIGYSESWEIEDLQGAPVFRRTDTMGGGRTDSLEGVTCYATVSIDEHGRELRGRFTRDGTRAGSFVMRRMGDPVRLGSERDGAPRE